jgi:hypothetical protein
MAFAGIWKGWQYPDSQPLRTFAIDPNLSQAGDRTSITLRGLCQMITH